MHAEALAWVTEQATALGWCERVADFGGLNINGTPRQAFACDIYTAIDLVGGPGVDEVGDAATWESKEPVDVVVCCEVLEHTEKAQAIVTNAARNLCAGGVLVLTAAGEGRAPHSAVDGGPLRDGEFYRNVTQRDLVRWLRRAGFRDVDVETHRQRGDIYALARK